MRRAMICGALAVCLGLLPSTPVMAASPWHLPRPERGLESVLDLLQGFLGRLGALLGPVPARREPGRPALALKTGCHLDPWGCPSLPPLW